MLSRIEKQLKRRFAIGSQVSEHSIVQDFTKQVSRSNFFFANKITRWIWCENAEEFCGKHGGGQKLITGQHWVIQEG